MQIPAVGTQRGCLAVREAQDGNACALVCPCTQRRSQPEALIVGMGTDGENRRRERQMLLDDIVHSHDGSTLDCRLVEGDPLDLLSPFRI